MVPAQTMPNVVGDTGVSLTVIFAAQSRTQRNWPAESVVVAMLRSCNVLSSASLRQCKLKKDDLRIRVVPDLEVIKRWYGEDCICQRRRGSDEKSENLLTSWISGLIKLPCTSWGPRPLAFWPQLFLVTPIVALKMMRLAQDCSKP